MLRSPKRVHEVHLRHHVRQEASHVSKLREHYETRYENSSLVQGAGNESDENAYSFQFPRI